VAEDVEGHEPGAAPRTASRRPGRGPLVAAIAAAAVFAVVACVLAVLLAGTEEGADDGDLRQAAGRFAEAMVTYDHRDPAAHREAVLAGATGSFRTQYAEAFDAGLGELITSLSATSTGTVEDVYVTEIDAGQALAIVVVDITTRSDAGDRVLDDVYMRLTMVRVEGKWLVDEVVDLTFGEGGGLSPGTVGDTSTTIPADPTAPSVP